MIVGTAHGIAGEMSREQETEGSSRVDAAFEELYLGNYSRTVGVLFRLLGDRTRAEELANDVFLKLYRQGLLSNPDGNVAGWLYLTATNLGIDALRAANNMKTPRRARSSKPARLPIRWMRSCARKSAAVCGPCWRASSPPRRRS